jgi:hypothetical protein
VTGETVPVTDRDPAHHRPPPPQIPSIIRAGCTGLVALGVLTAILAFPSVVNPPRVQCTLAAAFIKDANKDSKKFNDVDLGGRDVDKLPCDEAVALANRIPKDEKGTKMVTIPSPSAIRFRGLLTVFVGLGQAISGLLTLKTLDRRARTAALGFAAMGVVFPIVGLFATVLSLFAVYTLALSPPSRELWPRAPESGFGGRPG